MTFILATISAIAILTSASVVRSHPLTHSDIEPSPGVPDDNASEVISQTALTEALQQQCLTDVLPYSSLRHQKSPVQDLHMEGRNGGELYYFGITHTSDPQHPQFKQLEHNFYRVQPTIVFYEGPTRSLPNDPTAAIQEAGEPGLIRYLARQHDIPIARLEPSRQAEIDTLLEQFTPEQVKLFYVLRQVAELRDVWNTTSKSKLQQAVIHSIDQLSVFDGLKTVITDLNDFETSYQNHWRLPTKWWHVPRRWFHPVLTIEETGGVFTNDIHRTASTFRNRHMVQVLTDAVNQGHRVMAVVGRGHLPLQRPALECRIQQ